MASNNSKYDLTELHPDQAANQTLYKFLMDSYTGKGGYHHSLDCKNNDYSLQGRANSQYIYGSTKQIAYLDRYCSEDISDYYERLTTSEFYNFTKVPIDLYSNFLFRRPIIRKSNNATLNQFLDSNNMNCLIANVEKTAAIYGWCAVLVDLPEVDESITNMKEAMDAGYHGPQFSVIDPTRIINWGLNEDGELDWIRYVTSKCTISNPFDSATTQNYYTTWTKSEYFIHLESTKKKGDCELIKQGTNPFNEIPIAIFKFADSSDSEIIGESQAFEIAMLNKAHYNRKSELTNLLRGQAFSQLVIPANPESLKPGEIKTGIGSVIYVPPDSATKAEYISPNSANATILAAEIENIEDNIMRVASLEWVRSLNSGRAGAILNSGVSRKFSFSQCNAKLKNIAKRLEAFEYELIELVSLAMGENLEYDYSVEYPTNYELDSMTSDFRDLFCAIQGGLPASAINKMRLKLADEMVFPTDEERLVFASEVESIPAVVVEVAPLPISPLNNQQ